MQVPGISTPLRLSAVLGLALAGATVLTGRGGEGVIFSDSEQAGARLEDSKPTPPQKQRWQIANPWDQFGRRGGSSLDAVTLPPFAPAAPNQPPVVPLTEKEWQMLKERQNWLLYRRFDDPSPSGRDSSEWLGGPDKTDSLTPSRAPGQDSPDARKARQGWLTDYYEQLSKNRGGAESAVPEPLRNSGGLDPDRARNNGLPRPGTLFLRDGTPLPAGAESLRPIEMGGFTRGATPGRQTVGSDAGRAETLSSSGRQERERPEVELPAWQQGAWGANRLRQDLWSRPSQPGVPGPEGQPLEGVARILGSNPLGNPLASASLEAAPLSSLDPVNAYLDPTREALNPVRPVTQDPLRVTPSGTAGLEPPERRRMLTTAPGVLSGDLPAAAGPALSRPVNGGSEERRSLHSIKVNLELPRRSF